jgi:phosphonate transport system substrate-binding protein
MRAVNSGQAMLTRRLCLAGGAALALSACREADTGPRPSMITFSVPADSRAGRRQSDWRPLFADMEQATGLRVRPYFAPSDTALLSALRERRVDAGWFSNEAALGAVRSANGEVFARTIAASGADARQSVLIVKSGARVTVQAIKRCDKQLTYGQGDKGSTPDYLAPIAFFFGPARIEPRTCFKSVRTADAAANLAAVANGTLDVAASDSAFLQRLADGGRAEPSKVTEIWASPPLPEDPILWRRDLDPDVKERLRQFFITYARGDTPQAAAQRGHLVALDVGGFEVADDNHLLLAREMEARERWAEAQWSGDVSRIEPARRAVDAIVAERQAFEGRVRAQAGTQ